MAAAAGDRPRPTLTRLSLDPHLHGSRINGTCDDTTPGARGSNGTEGGTEGGPRGSWTWLCIDRNRASPGRSGPPASSHDSVAPLLLVMSSSAWLKSAADTFRGTASAAPELGGSGIPCHLADQLLLAQQRQRLQGHPDSRGRRDRKRAGEATERRPRSGRRAKTSRRCSDRHSPASSSSASELIPCPATKAVLMAPADVPTNRSGSTPRSPSACSMPT